MGGAYTAKPDATVEDPDVPDGWDFDWPPPPGAFPPGYEPELSFTSTGPDYAIPGLAASGFKFKLADHDTFVTSEPSDQVTYTAVLVSDGSQVDLKFSGGDSFLAYVSNDYGDAGDDFWGGLADLEFDIGDSEIGDSIVLTATSDPFGRNVVGTYEIGIIAFFLTAVLTVVHTPDPTGDVPGPTYTNCRWQTRFGLDGGDSLVQRGSAWVNASGSSRSHYLTECGSFDVTTKFENDETFKIECLEFFEGIYTIKLGSSYVANTTMTIDMTLVLSDGTEYNKTTEWPLKPSGAWEYEDWLTIDSETGDVTIINP